MRTTLNLDSGRSIPLGAAASELVRRGMETPAPMRMVNGFYVVDLPTDGPQVSSARVKELLEDEI